MLTNIQMEVDLQPGSLEEVARIAKLSCGVRDRFAVLRPAQNSATEGVLYDGNAIGRGFDMKLGSHIIDLTLRLPAANEEIETLYRLIYELMDFYKGTTVKVDGIKAFQVSLPLLQKELENRSLDRLAEMGRQDTIWDLRCARFPLAITKEELESLKGLGALMHERQNQEVEVAVPHFHKLKNGCFGILEISRDVPTILPNDIRQYEALTEDNVDGWKVKDENKKIIPYDKFIRHASLERFDAKHVVAVIPKKKRFLVF